MTTNKWRATPECQEIHGDLTTHNWMTKKSRKTRHLQSNEDENKTSSNM